MLVQGQKPDFLGVLNMKQTDFDQFNQIISAVGELYGKPVGEFAISLWWNALSGCDLKAVKEALSRHVRNPDNGQFMPKPADVVRMMQGSTQDSALSAWAKVDRALRQIGPYETVVFDDPLIHVVLHEMGGWVGLGTKTDDDWPFVAKEFENRYRGFKARGEVPQYPPRMIGISESHNGQKGFEIAQPMLIGNADKAKSVMLGGTTKPLLGMVRAQEHFSQPLQLIEAAAA